MERVGLEANLSNIAEKVGSDSRTARRGGETSHPNVNGVSSSITYTEQSITRKVTNCQGLENM